MKPPDYKDQLDVGGQTVTIRTMQSHDRDIEDDFVSGLSPQSRYLRFHSALKQLSASMLEKFTNVNYPDEMALIATITTGNAEQQIAVARYARLPEADCAEVAVVVADDWQGKGIATRLLTDLRVIAHQAGIRHLELTVLPDNKRMLALAQNLGFRVQSGHHDFLTIELGKDLNDKPRDDG